MADEGKPRRSSRVRPKVSSQANHQEQQLTQKPKREIINLNVNIKENVHYEATEFDNAGFECYRCLPNQDGKQFENKKVALGLKWLLNDHKSLDDIKEDTLKLHNLKVDPSDENRLLYINPEGAESGPPVEIKPVDSPMEDKVDEKKLSRVNYPFDITGNPWKYRDSDKLMFDIKYKTTFIPLEFIHKNLIYVDEYCKYYKSKLRTVYERKHVQMLNTYRTFKRILKDRAEEKRLDAKARRAAQAARATRAARAQAAQAEQEAEAARAKQEALAARAARTARAAKRQASQNDKVEEQEVVNCVHQVKMQRLSHTEPTEEIPGTQKSVRLGRITASNANSTEPEVFLSPNMSQEPASSNETKSPSVPVQTEDSVNPGASASNTEHMTLKPTLQSGDVDNTDNDSHCATIEGSCSDVSENTSCLSAESESCSEPTQQEEKSGDEMSVTESVDSGNETQSESDQNDHSLGECGEELKNNLLYAETEEKEAISLLNKMPPGNSSDVESLSASTTNSESVPHSEPAYAVKPVVVHENQLLASLPSASGEKPAQTSQAAAQPILDNWPKYGELSIDDIIYLDVQNDNELFNDNEADIPGPRNRWPQIYNNELQMDVDEDISINENNRDMKQFLITENDPFMSNPEAFID